jgi:hypothetical protein
MNAHCWTHLPETENLSLGIYVEISISTSFGILKFDIAVFQAKLFPDV